MKKQELKTGDRVFIEKRRSFGVIEDTNVRVNGMTLCKIKDDDGKIHILKQEDLKKEKTNERKSHWKSLT
jgi:hypothetical protein